MSTATTTATLAIPHIGPDDDTCTAGLKYAAAGMYVGPVTHRTKHPGSVLGGGWPKLTSTDPQVIVSWFAGTDHGVFIHSGRSGLLIFDVDKPDRLHPDIRRAIDELHPPYQTTRTGDTERGHYLFAQPPSRNIGNSPGGLANGWGEVRGTNGVTIVAPSAHEDPDGLYVWRRTGSVPVLPAYLADQMPDSLETADAATDVQVTEFLNAHTLASRPGLLDIHVRAYTNKVEAGESRHQSMTGHLSGAMKEAKVGCYDARTAADALESPFLVAVQKPASSKNQGAARSKAAAKSEWRGLLAWAVAQAKAKDPADIRARIEEKVPQHGMPGLWTPPPVNGASGNGNGNPPGDAASAGEGEGEAPTRQKKPTLDVTSPAVAVNWARENLGAKRSTADIFRRGPSLVRVPLLGDPKYLPPKHLGDNNGPATVVPIDNIGEICALMSARYDLRRTEQKKDEEPKQVPAQFPPTAARDIIGGPTFVTGARWLQGVTHVPVLREDGTILDQPGYDAPTGMLYLPAADLHVPPIPVRPTREQVTAATNLLLSLVCDFKFVTDSDRCNYLGAMLTPIMRTAARGAVSKLLAIGAPMQGSGKTLLAEVLHELHGSVRRGPIPDGEELRKEIGTILSTTTAPVVTFDNQTEALRSAILANLITSNTYQNRKLGTNEQMSVPNDRLWIVTGNNLRLGGEMPRRTTTVTIDPGIPNPAGRTGFKIPDLTAHVRNHRGEILAALLTIARAWFVDGCPTVTGAADSFQRWRETVGGVLAHAGVAGSFDDPATATDPVGEDDSDYRSFLEAVERVYGADRWTVADLLGRLDPSTFMGGMDVGRPLSIVDLPVSLASLMRGSQTGPKVIARPLGEYLRDHDGRWAGDVCIRKAGKDSHSKTVQWRVDRYRSC